jgi:hypothetical protein
MTVRQAFAIAPLTTPMLYWSMEFGAALADPNRRHLALQSPLNGFALVIAFGAPIAYAVTLGVGLPALYLSRGKRPRLITALVAGGASGLATALVLHPFLTAELFSIPLSPVQGAVLGAATATVLWYLLPDA